VERRYRNGTITMRSAATGATPYRGWSSTALTARTDGKCNVPPRMETARSGRVAYPAVGPHPGGQGMPRHPSGAAAPDPGSKGLGAPSVYYPPCSAHPASPSPAPRAETPQRHTSQIPATRPAPAAPLRDAARLKSPGIRAPETDLHMADVPRRRHWTAPGTPKLRP
jgi:hypothetical protein